MVSVQRNYCADNFDAVLVDQCRCETLDTFLHNVSLFPNKIRHKFAGCPSTAFVDFVNPYLKLTDNYTDSDGRTVLRSAGIDVKYLTLVTEALNLTLNYTIRDKKMWRRKISTSDRCIRWFQPSEFLYPCIAR